jgi:hypothetical protein
MKSQRELLFVIRCWLRVKAGEQKISTDGKEPGQKI